MPFGETKESRTHQITKMEKETGDKTVTPDEIAPAGGKFASELAAPIWSVITFDRCAAGGITYDEAVETLKRLKAEKVSGLCIVTDEAAKRLSD